MKKIYISGQITGIESHAPALFEAAESFLRSKGYNPINPMKLPHNHGRKWEDFMKEDLKALMDCDAVYMMSNYTKSDGAKLELHNAIWLKMAVFHEEYSFVLDYNKEQQ